MQRPIHIYYSGGGGGARKKGRRRRRRRRRKKGTVLVDNAVNCYDCMSWKVYERYESVKH
jgi:hypothetical protein